MKTTQPLIVVGLDRSEADHGVLASAARIAARMNARLLLVHAAPIPRAVMEAFATPIASLEKTMLDEAQAYVDAAAKALPPAMVAVALASYGVAWSSLCDAAKRHAAKLVVVGARGHRRTHLLGSTATVVVNHSPCSVYVARDRPGKDTERVLAGLDGSDLSTLVLGEAAAFAHGEQRRVLIFRAIEPDSVPAREAAAAERAKLELAAYASKVEARAPVDLHVRAGVAWSALCDAARDYDVDLLVIGAHGHGAAKRLLGTTAARVVVHAAQSVLVARGSST